MQISKIFPSKHRRGRFLVWLEDGSLLRVGETEMIDFALHAGMELPDEVADRLLTAANAGQLRDKALNMLTVRPMSRKELTDKLLTRGAAPAQAAEIADWLERLGLLNDAEYAKTVVRHYSEKGYGPYKVKDELYRRGLSRDLWEDALCETKDPAEAIDAFLRQKLKGEVPEQKALKRVSDALARRGYRWSDISAGLRRYGADVEE